MYYLYVVAINLIIYPLIFFVSIYEMDYSIV